MGVALSLNRESTDEFAFDRMAEEFKREELARYLKMARFEFLGADAEDRFLMIGVPEQVSGNNAFARWYPYFNSGQRPSLYDSKAQFLCWCDTQRNHIYNSDTAFSEEIEIYVNIIKKHARRLPEGSLVRRMYCC